MNLQTTSNLEAQNLDGWIVPFLEDGYEGPGVAIDERLGGAVKEAIDAKEFSAKPDKVMLLRTLGKLPVSRLAVLGLGKREGAALARVMRGYAAAARALRESGARRIGALLPPDIGHDEARVAQAIGEGVVVGLFDFKKYKGADENEKEITEFYLQGGDAAECGLREGAVIGEASNFARLVANEVPSVATPEYVAQRAKTLAEKNISFTVLDEHALADRGLNAILAVGRGSANKPRMVALEYRGAGDDAPLYAVVGKGITFDSGGLSLKPAASMEDMKLDKCGACAVMGVMKAVSELNLKVNVLGVMALAENLPGGHAYKPGDIVTAGSGKTIEVLNTDAEGRVVLADALYYAGQRQPAAIVDMATLTGACVVALGDLCAGVMGNDEPLIRGLIEAGETTGERLWQLPLWPEYDEKVKSEVADVKNIGERSGGTGMAGAIAGASFLKAFVPEGIPWAHLDIAGTASDGKKRAYRGPGATGFGVRLVVEWLRKLA